MAVLNYTTTIAATKTVGEMQTALAKAGANRVMVEYAGHVPSALSFSLATPHGDQEFTLPCDIDAMHRLLTKQLGRNKKGSTREQAERVAWRVLKDWLAAQLALVETQMVEMDQVMLPYLSMNGRTLYSAYKADRDALRAITTGEDTYVTSPETTAP